MGSSSLEWIGEHRENYINKKKNENKRTKFTPYNLF